MPESVIRVIDSQHIYIGAFNMQKKISNINLGQIFIIKDGFSYIDPSFYLKKDESTFSEVNYSYTYTVKANDNYPIKTLRVK